MWPGSASRSLRRKRSIAPIILTGFCKLPRTEFKRSPPTRKMLLRSSRSTGAPVSADPEQRGRQSATPCYRPSIPAKARRARQPSSRHRRPKLICGQCVPSAPAGLSKSRPSCLPISRATRSASGGRRPSKRRKAPWMRPVGRTKRTLRTFKLSSRKDRRPKKPDGRRRKLDWKPR
jgi:hypothetical protein